MLNQTLYPSTPPSRRSISDYIDFAEAIERIVYAKFITVNNTLDLSFEPTGGYKFYDNIPDSTEGYKQLLLDASPLCNAVCEPSDTRNEMLLINDVFNEIQNRMVIVKDIVFTSLFKVSKGGAGKTAEEVNTFLKDSLSSINDGYPQSQFRHSPMVSFQPNWFNPIVKANGFNLTAGLERTNETYGTSNKTLSGFGMQLPFYSEINRKISNITDLKVLSSLYNAIEFTEGTKYQRYPLLAEMTIYVLK